ncbi:MAG: DoxX family membrane protein [Sphingobacteriales bacterium]|nr:MAG: DoxX family membrane protein [Sphingobacteriales bacterium]
MTRIGQILYTVPFFVFGLFHLMGADAMAGMVPIPGGAIWIYITGLSMIAAGVSIILRKKTRLACLLLALLLLIYVLSIHLPGVIAGGDGAQAAMGNFLKDIGLMGAALVIANQFGND